MVVALQPGVYIFTISPFTGKGEKSQGSREEIQAGKVFWENRWVLGKGDKTFPNP